MPCGFFCNWSSFAICPKQMYGLQSHVSNKILSFVTKIVIIYFQISYDVTSLYNTSFFWASISLQLLHVIRRQNYEQEPL
jgi:hypothetical protein